MNYFEIYILLFTSILVVGMASIQLQEKNKLRFNKIGGSLSEHQNPTPTTINHKESAVKLGDTLKLRYVYNGNLIRVRIVETENNINTPGRVQKIHYKSSLASSLLGHTKGEIVKIGSLDCYVEILQIINSEDEIRMKNVDSFENAPMQNSI